MNIDLSIIHQLKVIPSGPHIRTQRISIYNISISSNPTKHLDRRTFSAHYYNPRNIANSNTET